MLRLFKKQTVVLLVLFLGIVTTGGFAEQGDEGKTYQYAELLYGQKDCYWYAKAEYLKVIYLFPDNRYTEQSMFMVAECSRMQSLWWPAISEYNEYLKKYPAGKMAQKSKNGIKMCKQQIHNLTGPILTAEQQMALRYISYGDIFLSSRVWVSVTGKKINQEAVEKAEYWYNEAIKICPAGDIPAQAQYSIGSLYGSIIFQVFPEQMFGRTREEDTKNITRSIEEYQKVIDKYPDSVWAKIAAYKIGDLYTDSLFNKEKGIEYYSKLMELTKENPFSWYYNYAVSRLAFLNNEFDDCLAIRKMQYQDIDPGIITAEEYLANQYINFGNMERNKKWKATYGQELEPNHVEKAEYWYNEALKLTPKGEYGAKVYYYIAEFYNEICQQDSTERLSKFFRAQDKKYIDKAIENYKKAIETGPDTYWGTLSCVRLANAYIRLFDTDSARKTYLQLMENKMKLGLKNDWYIESSTTQISAMENTLAKETDIFKIILADEGTRALTPEEYMASKYVSWVNNYFLPRSIRSGEFGNVFDENELNMAFQLIDEAYKMLPEDSPYRAFVLYYKAACYIKQDKMEYYQKAIDVLMEALKNPIHPYWKNMILGFIGDINRDYIKDKGDAIEAYKAIIVVNNCDEKARFVYQTMGQIQYLGGSLDFMDDYRKGKPVKLAKQYKFLVEPQKEQKE